jgi:hypothetical protein
MASPTPALSRGNLLFKAERRQYAGLLIITGFCALIQPLANIASGVGADGPIVTDASQVEFWQFVGSCCLFALGVSSMLVGYVEFIHDWGELTPLTLLIILTQSAFIPYVSDMVAVGKAAVKDPPQFFVVFDNGNDPAGRRNAAALDQDEVNMIGAVGVLGIFSYTFAFIGAIAFMQFALYAFRSGFPQDRNASYFQGRLGFYSLMLAIGGVCQILLGSFATELSISNGRIEGGLIRVAMFVVHFPYVTIVVGIVQFLNGFWGFARSFGLFVGGPQDHTYQYSLAFQWVMVLTMQDLVQISLLPEGMLASAAPTLAALSFGINFMPAFLDYKMRNTPLEIHEYYYFGPDNLEQDPEATRPIIERKTHPNPKPLELRKIYVVERQAVGEDDYYDGPDGRDAAPFVAQGKGDDAAPYLVQGQESI